MKNRLIYIIAGPCSIDNKNFNELYFLAKLKKIWGVRVVGLKSRTSFKPKEQFLGIDFREYEKNFLSFYSDKKLKEKFPSVLLMKKIIKETGLNVATEIMDPWIQLTVMKENLPDEKVFIWNPAINQLGWQIKIMAKFVKEKRWYLGLKNPKWYGKKKQEKNSMEETWEGIFSYALSEVAKEKIILIHRGVEYHNKGLYRNYPVHESARKLKLLTKVKLFFDPSHIHGQKLKNKIIEETIKAMQIKINNEEYLYDGILIEAGTSKTDTYQHVSLKEIKFLVDKLEEFRELASPDIKI